MVKKIYILGIINILIIPGFLLADDKRSENTYSYYIGGSIGAVSNVGASSVQVHSVIGNDNYTKNMPGTGMYGGMYVGIETNSGYSFEVGALQLGSSTDYTGSYGFKFNNRSNMTVPYFGFGYRIPLYLPDSLDTTYTDWLKKVSFKPFVGLGVGISNNIFYPNDRMRDYLRTTGNDVEGYVLPYFKINVQYPITQHLYLGGDVGFLLKTNYQKMQVDSFKGDIKIPGFNAYNSLLTGLSIEYKF
jgi:hypothetical protein